MVSIQEPSARINSEGIDVAAQQAARAAVMQIRLFPDLTVGLRRALGYGPHVDMLQHFCHWFHPRHPKMQERWTLYKTYREWHDECGLTDRQVKKGRKILRDLGLVTEKKGPYGRVHYRVNWVALAEALSLDGISVQTDELDDWFDLDEDEFSLDGISDQPQSGRYSDQSSLDGISVRPNTGDNAGEYLQDNSLLQSGAEPAKAEPAPPEMNRNKDPQEDYLSSPPDSNKRHSQDRDPQHETTAARDKEDREDAKDRRFIRGALEEPTPELSEALERYCNGEMDLTTLTDTMRGKPYLRGSMAWSALRPGQVAEVLAELELKPEGAAA